MVAHNCIGSDEEKKSRRYRSPSRVAGSMSPSDSTARLVPQPVIFFTRFSLTLEWVIALFLIFLRLVPLALTSNLTWISVRASNNSALKRDISSSWKGRRLSKSLSLMLQIDTGLRGLCRQSHWRQSLSKGLPDTLQIKLRTPIQVAEE